MSLTYQQDPKKYNPTIRLKRISQRFSPGYKHIRVLKEDYLGRLSNRISCKRNLQVMTKHFEFQTDYVRPGKKWKTLIPKSTLRVAFRQPHNDLKQSFLALYEIKANSHTSKNQLSSFSLKEGRQRTQIQDSFFEKSPVPRLFGLFFKQFHLPYDFTKNLHNTLLKKRVLYIEYLRNQEKRFKQAISKAKYSLKKFKENLKKGFRHPQPWKNNKEVEEKRRQDCLTKIKNTKERIFQLTVEFYNFVIKDRNILGKSVDPTIQQVPFFEYGFLTQRQPPNQFLRFPQLNTISIKTYETKKTTFYNLEKLQNGKLMRLTNNLRLCKIAASYFYNSKIKNALVANKLIMQEKEKMQERELYINDKQLYAELYISRKDTEEKHRRKALSFNIFDKFFGKLRKKNYSSRTAFNVFNFNTKSNQVLYRYMEILKQKFGVYTVDLPFRIDNYAKAHQKKRRPSKYKQMCLARAKIRLFYGQLTTKKIGRLLKQAKATFPHMFGLMERRLDVLLVRANFCKNIFTAQHIVKAGHILVNNKPQRNCFYAIKCYDYVTFKSKSFEQYCKYLILTKLRLNKFIHPAVPYLVINYKLMYLYVKPVFDARKQVGFSAPLSHSYLARF